MRQDATPSGPDTLPLALPRLRWRARVRNHLRRLERRWRREFPRSLPPWTGPVAGDPTATTVAISWTGDLVEITVESVGQLRAQLTGQALAGTVRHLDTVVTGWQAPWPGWSGRLGPMPGLVGHSAHLPRAGRGRATVHVSVAQPVAARILAAAALAVLDPERRLPALLRAEVVVSGDRPPWLPPELSPEPTATGSRIPRQRVSPEGASGPARPDDRAVPPYDLRLAGSRYGVTAPGGTEVVLVDATSANPRGRARYGPDLPRGELSLAAGAGESWWRIHAGGPESTLVVAGMVGQPLDELQTGALARLGWASATTAPVDVAPEAHASALAQLAMTGLVLHAPAPTGAAHPPVARELVELLTAPLPGPDADPIEWELRSIAQRRAALRGHASGFALQAAAGATYSLLTRPPSVTALLVTRRPRYAARAVADLAAQSYPELEIVIGLHGVDISATQRDQFAACAVPVEVVTLAAELSFGEALAAASRSARGSLVTKVDDDDRYGPEHVWDLVLARHYSGATIVGKAAEFVHLAPYNTTVRRRMDSECYTDVVAGGAMLLSRGDLEDVGGWRPLPRAVDRALLDRVLRAGGLVYRTHGFGFVYTRHTDGHTWDPGLRYFLLNPRRQWAGLPPFGEFGEHHADPNQAHGRSGEGAG